MDVRAQVATVFHLDKCLGCHTCSVACKNIWTDRKGAEYMWWNNVETKPGTGFPTKWEDQSSYHGGWERRNGGLRLQSTGKARIIPNIFHQPHMPTLDEYYEPWTYEYGRLFDAMPGEDQPTARPISLVTGKPLEINGGPNWDDDLGGSPVYAEHDPNLTGMSSQERRQLFAIERLMFFYLPRTCNHCLNPACVAACPSGAIHKRGEDGVVLVDQDRCRGWRACIAACPYKKVFYNWSSGKSEKCISCYPRIETGQPPACFHGCVGRIRYFGVLLYDASRLKEAASSSDDDVLAAHRSLILDPWDPAVVDAAQACGIENGTLEAARQSPVFAFVKRWKLALPLHVEFRTLPMLFYVPPLSPVAGGARDEGSDLFHAVDNARTPIKYLSRLFGAGSEGPVRASLRRQIAIRAYRRAITVGDIEPSSALQALEAEGCSREDADQIYALTALATYEQRFVVPPAHREELGSGFGVRGSSSGFGFGGRVQGSWFGGRVPGSWFGGPGL